MRNIQSIRLSAFICLAVMLLPLLGLAQYSGSKRKAPKTRILFIYDASNSMNGKWQSANKNTIARKLLSQSLDSLADVENLELALRVYGHQKDYRKGQDCNDTKLEVAFAPNNTYNIKAKLASIVPKGTTPIAKTLEKSAGDFSFCADCRNIIIMITDGIEECDGDPCAISMKLQERGIILKPFVIGIGLDMDFKKSFECIGNYYDASDEKTFKRVLNVVVSQALNSTTAQINLLDANGNPNETDVAISLYDNYSGAALESFMHTMNAKGNPDTLSLDPVTVYNMTVHTIPEVHLDSFQLTPGKHNVFGVDAAQGFLEIKAGDYRNRENIQAIVRAKGENKTLYVQSVNDKEKYLTGFYNLEILTLPRIYVNDVAVSQSHTTTIEIPKPGQLTVNKSGVGPCTILKRDGDELVKVYEVNPRSTRSTINLQPGRYLILYRPVAAKGVAFTQEESFIIKSGASVSINF